MRWDVVFYSVILSLLACKSLADSNGSLPLGENSSQNAVKSIVSEHVNEEQEQEQVGEIGVAKVLFQHTAKALFQGTAKILFRDTAKALFQGTAKASLRDPTMPLNYHKVSKSEELLVLSSILISKQRRVAVLNGVVVSEGSYIKKHEVLSIDRKQVVLKMKGKSIVLPLRRKISVNIRNPIVGAKNSISITKNIMKGDQ